MPDISFGWFQIHICFKWSIEPKLCILYNRMITIPIPLHLIHGWSWFISQSCTVHCPSRNSRCNFNSCCCCCYLDAGLAMKIAWAYPVNIIDAIRDNDLGYHPSPAQLCHSVTCSCRYLICIIDELAWLLFCYRVIVPCFPLTCWVSLDHSGDQSTHELIMGEGVSGAQRSKDTHEVFSKPLFTFLSIRQSVQISASCTLNKVI